MFEETRLNTAGHEHINSRFWIAATIIVMPLGLEIVQELTPPTTGFEDVSDPGFMWFAILVGGNPGNELSQPFFRSCAELS